MQEYILALDTTSKFWLGVPKDVEALHVIQDYTEYLNELLLSTDLIISERLNGFIGEYDMYSYETNKEEIEKALRILKEHKELDYLKHIIIKKETS